MLDPQIIQVVIQGGAVGILLMFGFFGYKLARLAIDKVSLFANNHVAHLTKAVQEGTGAMREVKTEIVVMAGKLDQHVQERRPNSEGWEMRD